MHGCMMLVLSLLSLLSTAMATMMVHARLALSNAIQLWHHYISAIRETRNMVDAPPIDSFTSSPSSVADMQRRRPARCCAFWRFPSSLWCADDLQQRRPARSSSTFRTWLVILFGVVYDSDHMYLLQMQIWLKCVRNLQKVTTTTWAQPTSYSAPYWNCFLYYGTPHRVNYNLRKAISKRWHHGFSQNNQGGPDKDCGRDFHKC